MSWFGASDPYMPGAYVNTETVLYEIVERTKDIVTLENVVTGWRHTRMVVDLVPKAIGPQVWWLTKAAPSVPDQLESD